MRDADQIEMVTDVTDQHTTPSSPASSATESGVPLDRATVVRWIEGLARAWREKDDVAAGELFTEDVSYQEVPGVDERTFVGRDAVRKYWRDITAPQQDVSIRSGEPVIQGNRAAIELWITMRNNGEWATLIESNVLYFTRDGLCYRNVEYWIWKDGRLDPPEGWGSSS